MMKRRCDKLCIEWGLGRWVYLIAGTLLLLGFIVEMICLGMIIIPYLRENEFVQASCQFVSSRYSGRANCQDVFYRSPSNFPCLIATVRFNTTESNAVIASGTSGSARLYLLYSYYAEATVAEPCSSRICYKDKDLNTQQIANLNVTYYNNNRTFTCYVRPERAAASVSSSISSSSSSRSLLNSALYNREFSESQVFHCITWPLLAFGIGSLLIWSVFCASGCDVWGSDMTI